MSIINCQIQFTTTHWAITTYPLQIIYSHFFHFQIQRRGKRCNPNSMDASGVDSPQQVSLLKPCLSICIFLVFLPYLTYQLDEIDPPQQVGILPLKYNTKQYQSKHPC